MATGFSSAISAIVYMSIINKMASFQYNDQWNWIPKYIPKSELIGYIRSLALFRRTSPLQVAN